MDAKHRDKVAFVRVCSGLYIASIETGSLSKNPSAVESVLLDHNDVFNHPDKSLRLFCLTNYYVHNHKLEPCCWWMQVSLRKA